jgi:tetratricopeptide (TPR) repeat protein
VSGNTHGVLEDHLVAGRLDPAEAMARHLLEANGDDAIAHVALARVYAARGNNDEAIKRLERLLAARPRQPEALAYLAVLWSAKGEKERALLLGRRAVAFGARVPQNDSMLGDDALERGAFDESLRFYDRALTLNGRLSGAWFGRGKALRASNKLADAEDALARAVELAPLRVDAWIQLILVERQGGAFDAASDNLALALKAHPGHPELLALKAEDEARAAKRDDPVEKAMAAVRGHLFRGEIDTAEESLNTLLKVHKGDARLFIIEAEVAAVTGNGDIPLLVNSLNRLVRDRVTAWEPRAALGRLILRPSQMQNVRMGIAHCEEAWRTSGEHPRAGIYLVEAYLALGKRRHAHALGQKLARGDTVEAVRARQVVEQLRDQPRVESRADDPSN